MKTSQCSISIVRGILVFLVFASGVIGQTQYGVPLEKIAMFRRGCNTAGGGGVGTYALSDSYVSGKKSQGYTFLRYCIQPSSIMSGATGINSTGLNNLKNSVAVCKKYGMGCLAEIHKVSQSNPVGTYMDPSYVEYMGKLAAELNSGVDLDYLILEVINEPTPPTRDDAEWYEQQNRIVAEMRRQNPDLTIALDASQCFLDDSDSGGHSGINWEQVSCMVRMQMPPPEIQNIIVTFHDYQPMTFTHQGASWVDFFSEIRNIKYPPDTANVEWAKGRTDHPYALSNLQDYLDRGWGREVFEKRYAAVAQWRVENGNPFIIVGEFGATSSTGGGRDQYYRDITSTMEKYNCGWAWWWGADGSSLGMDTPLEEYNPEKGNPTLINHSYSITNCASDNLISVARRDNGCTILSAAGAPVALRLLDLSGKVCFSATVEHRRTLSVESPGTYLLQMRSANGTTGISRISIHP
jgi:hypothetical protein